MEHPIETDVTNTRSMRTLSANDADGKCGGGGGVALGMGLIGGCGLVRYYRTM